MFIKYCIAIFIFCSFSYANTIKVYVSKQLQVDSLSKSQITMLYLKKTNLLNNQKIIVYDNIQNHDDFVEFFLHKTPYQVHAYWMKQIFLGKNIAPEKLNNKQLNEKLQNTPNAIVYSTEQLEGKVVYEIQ